MLLWLLVFLNMKRFGEAHENYPQVVLADLYFFKGSLEIILENKYQNFFFLNNDSKCDFLLYKKGPDSIKIAVVAVITKIFRVTLKS